ncbi:MAG: hypothetical protein M1836_000244 [Candelina mexicana]|nr:MAG: hypothetical protein M1836_000244 [Candelina mexicana]
MERISEKRMASLDAEREIAAPQVTSKKLRVLGKHGIDADEAMKAFAGQEGEVNQIDDATNRRLLRRIDMNLLPCLIHSVDVEAETTLSYASVMGIRKDINLIGDDYQWLGSMFYFGIAGIDCAAPGYIAWEYPTNRLLQRLPLAKYSSFCVTMWGLVLCCMAAVENYSGALAVRFMLGVFEAAVTPGFALFTSQWYTKKEQGTRTGIWFSFNGWAQIFGGLVAYGIAKGARIHGSAIAPWRVVFLVTGLLTAALGVIFLSVMPDNQLNARWLNPVDRRLAVERIRVNQQGVGNKHWKRYQFIEALTDPLTWAFTFYALVADIPNGGISNFFSQLIVSFGYTQEESLLYGTPGGAVEVVALIVCGFLGDRYGHRILISTSGLVLSIVGMLLIVALPLQNNGGRLAGYYLTQASPTGFVALLSLISSNVAGYTKKTTVAAMYLIAYCAGNIVGPQVFRPKDAPRYTPAQVTIICCWSICVCDLLFIWWWCQSQNKKKATFRSRPEYEKLENQE